MIFGPPTPLESSLMLTGAGPSGGGDSTPGGAADVWALEDDLFGWLLEDGSSFWLIET